MSGGYSIVVAGTTITASRENQYVARQVITRHASSSARNSAISTDAEEGMYADLADTDALERYDGTSWVPGVPKRMGSSTRTSSITGVTTTETIADSLTVTLQAGRRYKLTWTGVTYMSAAGESYEVRFRYAAGSSVTSSGTLLLSRELVCPTINGATPTTVVYEFNGLSAGQTTFGVFAIRTFGSGTVIFSASSDNKTQLLVEDIGV